METLGQDAMVLPSAPVRYHSGDTEYRYRPDSELYYVTGFEEPGSVAVLRPFARTRRFVVFVRPRDPKGERWSGPRMGPERAKETLGADAAYPIAQLERRLPTLLSGAAVVHYRLGSDTRTQLLVSSALRTARARGARTGSGPRGVMDPGVILDEMRLRKDPEEVALVRRAAEITCRAFSEALAAAGAGAGEWDVESALEAAFRREGARGPAFPTIVGSGPNACVLHYVDNARRMRRGDLVLVDGGAELGWYSGDVTRTVPVSGSFTPRQRSVYGIVEEARSRAVASVRPGATLAEVHGAAVAALVEGLVDLGVLKGESRQLIRRKAHEAYFPHRTYHWLGLDVHDVGDYMVRRKPRVLEPGMVLTVEPGLYFSQDADGPAAPFAAMGVRIEDDVLVTEEGCEVLTGALPTEPDAIAALVGGAGGARGR